MSAQELDQLDARLRVLIPELQKTASPTRSTMDAANVFKHLIRKHDVLSGQETDREEDGSETTYYWFRCVEVGGSHVEAETWELAVAQFALQLLDCDVTP